MGLLALPLAFLLGPYGTTSNHLKMSIDNVNLQWADDTAASVFDTV
jgi:hypothetical protein